MTEHTDNQSMNLKRADLIGDIGFDFENGKPAIRAEPWSDTADIEFYNGATPDEIIKRWNSHARLVEALRDAADAMEGFNRAPGATRDEWEFECEVKEIETLLTELGETK